MVGRRQPGLFTFLPDRPLLTLRPNRRSDQQTIRICAESIAQTETDLHYLALGGTGTANQRTTNLLWHCGTVWSSLRLVACMRTVVLTK